MTTTATPTRRKAPRKTAAKKRIRDYELYPRQIGIFRQWRGSDITVVKVAATSARQARSLLVNDRVAARDGDIGILFFIPRDEAGQTGTAWPWRSNDLPARG